MEQRGHSTPLPVEGVVFERSRGKTLHKMLFWCFCWVFAAWFAIAWVANKKPISLNEGSAATACFLIGGPFMVIREARACGARRRLVVGEDRIQVIERRRGEDHVILQIPYANIAKFKCEDSNTRVGINLYRLDDGDTYAPGENFERNYRKEKRHYCITYGYRHGVRAIASEMEKAYSRWHSRAEEERHSAKHAADLLRAAGESEPERQGEVDLIWECRERFGFPPRLLSASDAEVCRLTLAPKMEQKANGDPLLTILAEQYMLRDRGQVYWGHLIQANSLLFKPDNPHTLPAYIVYSTDPFFDCRVSILASFAKGLFA